MAIKTKAWRGTAELNPMLDYLRGLGPGIHHINPDETGRALGMQARSVMRELHYLAETGQVRYDADGSGLVSVRAD
jgi:hypothetical protein